MQKEDKINFIQAYDQFLNEGKEIQSLVSGNAYACKGFSNLMPIQDIKGEWIVLNGSVE